MSDPRKPYADALRDAGLDFNRPGVVSAFDALLDKAGVPRAGGLTTSDAGIDLIKRFEGLELRAYPDPGTGGKPWTIGIGTTVYPSGQAVKAGDVITEAQAEQYLRHDLARFEEAVNKLTGGVATQGQFDALVSLAYNIGETALKHSTLLRLHNEGDYAAAANQFQKWVLAGGKKLTDARQIERDTRFPEPARRDKLPPDPAVRGGWSVAP